jgi:hypothetical protein
VRAIGPTWAKVGVALVGKTGTRPKCPLMPSRPESAEGTRIEPPPCVPSPRVVTPAAMLAPAPALEPPGVFDRSHGLRVTPVNGDEPTPLQPNSLVVVLPMTTPCARRTRSTEGASTAATFSAMAREPKVSLASFTAIRSFTNTGKPARAPTGSPRRIDASTARAAEKAWSSVTCTKALMSSSTSLSRASVASTTSSDEISFAQISSRSSSAGFQRMSDMTSYPQLSIPQTGWSAGAPSRAPAGRLR